MKHILKYLLALLALLPLRATAECVYNERYGQFSITKDVNLEIVVDTSRNSGAAFDSLTYIAFATSGSRSGRIDLKAKKPVRLGFFTAGTSLTFWLTSVDPLSSVQSVTRTSRVELIETAPQGPKLYALENVDQGRAVAFVLNEIPVNSNRAQNLKPMQKPATARTMLRH